MIKYEEFVNDIYDQVSGREATEWSTSWIDRADKAENGRRVLFIGDSTLRAVRGTFANMTGLPIDCIGSSSGLHDRLFAEQMDAFLCSDKYSYTDVFIQLGYHSIINDAGDKLKEEDYLRFEADFNGFLDFVGQFCSRIVLLSAFYSVIMPEIYTSTHNAAARKLINRFRKFSEEKWDSERNAIMERKNGIIRSIAGERGLTYYDINQFMIGRSRSYSTRYMHTDDIHYEETSIPLIAGEYRKLL